MKVLQLHQVSSVTRAGKSPLTVSARFSEVNSSRSRGGADDAAARCQRSGSRTKARTAKATRAASSPQAKTYRQETSGADRSQTPAIWWLAKVARNRPNGADV